MIPATSASGGIGFSFDDKGGFSKLMKNLSRIQRHCKNLSTPMRKVMDYMIKRVVVHFSDKKNPATPYNPGGGGNFVDFQAGAWKAFSELTAMISKADKQKNKGLLLKSGTLRNSFGTGSSKSGIDFATVGSAYQVKGKKGAYNLAAIHHYGAKIKVSDDMKRMFAGRWGIILKSGNTLTIPARQVLWLDEADNTWIKTRIGDYIIKEEAD